MKIIATKCIENFLDIDCPGLLMYRNGDYIEKIIPAREVFGGKHMTQDTVEFVLAMKKIIDMEFEEDPRNKLKQMVINKHSKRVKRKDSNESDEDDDREYTSNQIFRYRH